MKLSKHIVRLFIVGLFCGLVASFFYYVLPIGLYAFLLIPGVFGLVVGLYFFISGKPRSLKNLIIFIFSSIFSILPAYFLGGTIMPLVGIPLGLYFGGMVWAGILLFAFSKLIFPLSLQKFLNLVMFGGVLTSSFYLTPYQNYNYGQGMLLVFPVWLSIMAAGIGWATDKNSKRK